MATNFQLLILIEGSRNEGISLLRSETNESKRLIHHSYLRQAESQMLKACLYITKIRTGGWGVGSLSALMLGTLMEDGAIINTTYL